jgi:hypothetical protein
MNDFMSWIGPLAWAWLILIGIAIIITPNGPICTVCGPGSNLVIGIISVVLGGIALVGRFTAAAR